MPSKKNSKKIITTRSGRRLLISSDSHRNWHTGAMWQLKIYGMPQISECEVIALFKVPDKRRRDLSNMWESVGDVLVDAGILEDDSMFHIKQLVLKGEINKEDVGVDLQIIH